MADARPAATRAGHGVRRAGPAPVTGRPQPSAPVTPLPAATVVLMRDRPRGRPEVLLLQRDRAARAGPGAYVFPGGVVEPQDSSPVALRLSPGLSPVQAQARLGLQGGAEPPEAALAFYVAAIRETFEEALVLLAEPVAGGAGTLPPRAALLEARERMHAGALNFLDWAAAAGLRLVTQRLVYFAHWITPEVIAERFSARFFLIRAPDGAAVEPDRREVLQHRWLEPAEAIALRRQGDIHLMEPTVRNLELLGAFASTEEALRELNRRPVQAILPKLKVHADGSRTLLYPWEDEYLLA
jgi:8-oxo-dGTP pyrophosphatase MutT (NUDIX family)